MKHLEMIDMPRIRVSNRVRKDLGDIQSLAESMRAHGLLNPIVLTGNYELVAGHRRLEAARRLGWRVIQCRIVESGDPTPLLQIEMEENTARKRVEPDELADALTRLDRLRNPPWYRRLGRWFRRLWKRLTGWMRRGS